MLDKHFYRVSWSAGILNGEMARPQDPAEYCEVMSMAWLALFAYLVVAACDGIHKASGLLWRYRIDVLSYSLVTNSGEACTFKLTADSSISCHPVLESGTASNSHQDFEISTSVLGYTVAAAGTSFPNVFSGMCVARHTT